MVLWTSRNLSNQFIVCISSNWDCSTYIHTRIQTIIDLKKTKLFTQLLYLLRLHNIPGVTNTYVNIINRYKISDKSYNVTLYGLVYIYNKYNRYEWTMESIYYIPNSVG